MRGSGPVQVGGQCTVGRIGLLARHGAKKYVFETDSFITPFGKKNVHFTYPVLGSAQNDASFYAAWLQT